MQILCEVQHDVTSNEATIPHRVQGQGLLSGGTRPQFACSEGKG